MRLLTEDKIAYASLSVKTKHYCDIVLSVEHTTIAVKWLKASEVILMAFPQSWLNI